MSKVGLITGVGAVSEVKPIDTMHASDDPRHDSTTCGACAGFRFLVPDIDRYAWSHGAPIPNPDYSDVEAKFTIEAKVPARMTET